MRKLVEGLKRNELDHLVDNTIHFDEYNSKMGRDDAVVTASFKVKFREPALDLVSFLESGYDWILDADISSGEVQDGQYIVFLEMQRSPKNYSQIMSMLDDIQNITNIKPDDWRFKWYKQSQYMPLTKENLEENLPDTPRKYREYVDQFVAVKEQTDNLAGEIANLKRLSGMK
jgi:hypothetical protein